ncbi:MAG: TolC family protein [Gammaproteobacteria bacterium]|nr:TolC family protein [Gammaproteobacteria bacterium]MDE0251615.1 TolC family protein [Gammaproteobacteria bacterium]MDE0403375.1 TolC family protein [Gammaproteobacteria bacterium]
MHLRIQGFILLWITAGVITESSIAEEYAESAFEKADLSLRQFVEDVVATNPRVKAARVSLTSEQTMRDAKAQPLYNPDFDVDVESTDSLYGTVGISQQFDWNGKRKARTEIADSNLLVAEAEFRAFRQAFVVDLLNGLTGYQIGRTRYDLVQERQQLMNNLVNRAQSRFEAGDISQVELNLVELAAMNVRMRNAQVQVKQLQTQKELQKLTPHTNMAQWPELPDDIPELPKDIEPNLVLQQLPAVQIAKLLVETNDSLAELRRRERRPDPTVSLKGGQDDKEFLIGLSINIPLFVRNSYKYEVEAAIAERSESQLIADDVLYRTRVDLENSTAQLRVLQSAWDDWQATSEESLSSPLDQLQRLWETGELSTTDYVVQLTETLEVRESALDLKESLWQAWFQWLLASGRIDIWIGVES